MKTQIILEPLHMNDEAYYAEVTVEKLPGEAAFVATVDVLTVEVHGVAIDIADRVLADKKAYEGLESRVLQQWEKEQADG